MIEKKNFLLYFFFFFFLLFFFTLLSDLCSVFSPSLFIHIFPDLPCCFLFKSAILYFLFSCHSLLSDSSFCSISIQSVLFLLFFIFESSICTFFFLSLNTFFAKDPMISCFGSCSLLFFSPLFSCFLYSIFILFCASS